MTSEARPRLTLLGRTWCHLCDDMRAALAPLAAQYPFELEVIDVDGDAQLERRYGEDVPVLLAGETELCRHRLDAARVAEFLANYRRISALKG
jgi:thiol-disulfide isomerase/thioredoxin